MNHGLHGSHGWGEGILLAVPAKCGGNPIVVTVSRQLIMKGNTVGQTCVGQREQPVK